MYQSQPRIIRSLKTQIVGLKSDKTKKLLSILPQNTYLKLIPERKNKKNLNAIRVEYARQKLGYIHEYHCAIIHHFWRLNKKTFAVFYSFEKRPNGDINHHNPPCSHILIRFS